MVLQQATLSIAMLALPAEMLREQQRTEPQEVQRTVCILSFRRTYARFSMLCITFLLDQTLRVSVVE